MNAASLRTASRGVGALRISPNAGSGFPAQLDRALLDLRANAETAQASLEVVGMRAREAGERGAEKSEEVAPLRVAPDESQG